MFLWAESITVVKLGGMDNSGKCLLFKEVSQLSYQLRLEISFVGYCCPLSIQEQFRIHEDPPNCKGESSEGMPPLPASVYLPLPRVQLDLANRSPVLLGLSLSLLALIHLTTLSEHRFRGYEKYNLKASEIGRQDKSKTIVLACFFSPKWVCERGIYTDNLQTNNDYICTMHLRHSYILI